MAKRVKRKPRKVTPKSLERAAVSYIQKFDTTTAHLKTLLKNRVRRSVHVHGTEQTVGETEIDAIIERFVAAGLIDDVRYAKARAEALHHRGASNRLIGVKLRQKGVVPEVIEATLEALQVDAGDMDLVAAINFVRRRRLGPFRTSNVRQNSYEKDLASLGRAGFGFGVAQRVLAVDSVEALDSLLTDSEPYRIQDP